MTEKVAKYTSESDDESENKPKFQSPEKLKDGNSQATLTTTVSAESDEYDTASEESGSGEYSDESETEGGEDQENEEGSIILDVERQSGDGQETDGENKKKVDDDEDRSNPQYIPKKGTFYEHDDRTAEDLDAEVEAVEEGEGGEETTAKTKEKEPKDSKITRKWQASQDRWTHDRFEENEQAPKSRNELVSAYGYDIRSEDGPPKARRHRRYGKGPNKYTRNWEDEAAYAKQTQQRKPRPEDFPSLNASMEKRPSKPSRHRNSDRQSSEYKENNDRNIERNEERRSQGGRDDRDVRGENNREQRKSYRENKAGGSTPNNRRSQNNQRNANPRNDNYRPGQNTLEFINQNRNKGSEPQKEPLSHRFASQQQSQQPQQQPQQNSNYHYQMHNVPPPQQQQQQGHYHQSNQINNTMSNDNVQKESINFTNTRINNQRYQNENVDDNRYHPQQQPQQIKDQRDTRQTTPISQTQQQQQQQQQQVIQPTQQQLQNYVQMQQNVQQATLQQQQQQQQKVQQQLQQMSQVQGVQNQGQAGDPSRTKRYSSLRQRTGMENVPQSQTGSIPVQQPPPNQQQMIQDQNSMMSEAAILQQLQQNEKLKQMQSTMAHQKQISYHQAITPQAPQQPPQASQALPLQNTNAAQYPPQAYYAQTAPEYQPAGVQQATPVQTQQPQMIAAPPQSASAQYAQYAPQNTPSYIQNAYLPQQPGPVPAQPPPQMYVPSIQQTAPQTQFQPQYSGYTPNFTPQPTTNQSTPIYQTQPPPSITYFAPTATNAPPTRVTRRPTNAIPILAPPERAGNGNSKRNEYETGDKMTTSDAMKQQTSAVGSAENIDHILDNMFVRRPPLQPAPMIKSASPSIDVSVTDSVKNLTLKDDPKEEKQQLATGTAEKVG